VIHGAGGENDGVHIFSGKQLGIAAEWDSEPLSHLLGAPFPGSGDTCQLGSRKPLGVLCMESPHPAETRDAKPKKTRRP
jgi:hypothetical protein